MARTAAPKTTAAKSATKEESIDQKRNRLRSEAEREVLNNHKDEFNKVAERIFKDNGLEFRRRLTPEERAAKQIEKLLAEHPSLRSQFDPAADTNAAPKPTGYEDASASLDGWGGHAEAEGPDYGAVADLREDDGEALAEEREGWDDSAPAYRAEG